MKIKHKKNAEKQYNKKSNNSPKREREGKKKKRKQLQLVECPENKMTSMNDNPDKHIIK